MTRSASAILVGGLLLLLGGNLWAFPIAVSDGDSITFNFDFVTAGATPSPDYSIVDVDAFYSDGDSGETAQWDFYSELNGGGSLLFSTAKSTTFASSGVLFDDTVFTTPGVYDGIFSVALTVSGDWVLDSLTATAEDASGNETQALTPTISTTGIPAPATLVLFGLGLAGMAWRQIS
jgi:hypothetical protein